MLKMLRYFYFILYKCSLKYNSEPEARYSSYWIIVILVELNFVIIFQILDYFLEIDFLGITKTSCVFFVLSIFYVFYLSLLKDNKPHEILDEFEGVNKNTRIVFNIILFIYIFGTLVLFYILL